MFHKLFSLGIAALATLHAYTPAQSGAVRAAAAADLNGNVRLQAGGSPVAGARVTLFRMSLSPFHETRSRPDGTYAFTAVQPGAYYLGVAAPGLEYEQVALALAPGPSTRDFALVSESHPGVWKTAGDTLPETFDATDIGVLRPDGWIFYCHDTTDPILFDPRTGQKEFPGPSATEQGCMNSTLMVDGSVLIAGGQDGADSGDFVNGIPWVKRFRPTNTWIQLDDMLLAAGRWYPGMARLNDGRLLVMGGGMSPDAARTDTCELFDPSTESWSWTATMGSPLEFPPAALLYTGLVLRTWGAEPELYDPLAETWTPTAPLNWPNRGYPGHSDHSLLVLTDGRALIVGANRGISPAAQMTEFFDPASGSWIPGTSLDLVRWQAEVIYLPDGRVLVQGGDKGAQHTNEPEILGIVRRCDLLSPSVNAWRRVADTFEFREYHAVTLLVPDGRVLTTGGTRIKFQYGPTTSNIDAYYPPYLFRGVRPEISELSDTSPSRGAVVSLRLFPSTRLTKVVLMGLQSTTHWVDAGIPRRLELTVSQPGTIATFTLPTDPNLLPLGWYMLFGMVDDIPSEALVLRVDL